MARRKKHSPEEIVVKLRQVEVSAGQGTPVADAIRSIGCGSASKKNPPISLRSKVLARRSAC
jgi:hypothetical protein